MGEQTPPEPGRLSEARDGSGNVTFQQLSTPYRGSRNTVRHYSTSIKEIVASGGIRKEEY